MQWWDITRSDVPVTLRNAFKSIHTIIWSPLAILTTFGHFVLSVFPKPFTSKALAIISKLITIFVLLVRSMGC